MLIIKGRPHTLMPQLIEQIQTFDKANEKCVVLVPSQYTLQAEKEILTRNSIQGTFHIDIISPGRLKSKVFDTAGYPAEQALNTQGKSMLLRKILREHADELQVFGQSAKVSDDGIVSSISTMLSNFKKSNTSPEDLRTIISALTEESAERKKLEDLSILYSAYEAVLSGMAADDDDMNHEMLRRLPRSEVLKDSHLLIYGFDMITPDFANEIVSLNEEAETVTLYMETDSNRSPDGYLFVPVNFSLQHLEQTASEKHVPIEYRTIEQTANKTEIERFSEKLYALVSMRAVSEKPDIRMMIASTPEMELKRTTAEIRRLLTAGYAPDEIAVAYPKNSGFGSYITSVFARYGLNAYAAEKRTAVMHPISVFLLKSLNIITDGWQTEDILVILSSGFTNLEDEQAETLYQYASSMQIHRGKWKKPFTYEKNGNAQRLKEVNEAREILIAPIEALEDELGHSKSGEAFAQSVFRYLEAVGAADKLEAMADTLREAGMDTAADDCVEIWNKLMDVLDQIHILLGDSDCEPEMLCSIMRSAFAVIELSSLPPTENTIQCGSIGNIRLPDVRCLFMIGMNDSQPGTGTELFTPEERQRTENAGRIYLGMDSSQRRALAQLDVLKTMLCAGETVYVSYASADSVGKALRPDPMVGRLKILLPGLEATGGVAEAEEAELYVSRNSAADVIGVTFSEYLERGMDPDRLPADKWEKQKQAAEIMRRNEEDNSRLGRMIEMLSVRAETRLRSVDPRMLYGRNTLSVSKLEQYAQCPYAEFINSGLKPEQEETAEMQRNELGEIYHKAAELFTNELTEQLLKETDPSVCDALMDRTIEPLLTEWSLSPVGASARGKAITRRIKRAAKVIGRNIASQYRDGGFRRAQTEFKFGENGVSPLILRLPDGGRVFLKGRIDRIDLYDAEQKCIRIIDYKTHGKKIDSTKVYWGLQLQLFIYLAAALEHYVDCEPGGIFYCPMEASLIKNDSREKETIEKALAKAMGLSGISLSDMEIIEAQGSVFAEGKIGKEGVKKNMAAYFLDSDDMGKVAGYAKEKAATLAQAMYNGRIERIPTRMQQIMPCDYCENKPICGFDVKRDRVRDLPKKSWADILGATDPE